MKWVLVAAAAILAGIAVFGWYSSHQEDQSGGPSNVDAFDVKGTATPDKDRKDPNVGGDGMPPIDEEPPKPPPVKEPVTIENFTWDSGDALTNGSFEVVKGVLSGKYTDATKSQMIDAIEKLLEAAQLGDDVRRQDVATAVADDILDQAQNFAGKTTVLANGLSPLQEQAIRSLSQTVASDFRKRIAPAAGAGQIHEGTLRAAVDFEVPAGHEKVSWKLLGGFEYKEGHPLPEDVTKLKGKKIGVAGYMMAMGDYADVHKFLLVESQWTCCFGVPPEIHQVVIARIPKERPGVELTSLPVLVLGTLDVGEEKDGKWVTSVYRIVCDDVIEIE